MQSSIAGIAITAAGPTMINQTGIEFAGDRKISRQTLECLNVASGTAFFPELGRKEEALFFKYSTGWKARALSQKAHVSNKGFRLEFWNIEAVLAGQTDTVYITEGEFDVCALVEAGISPRAVLSVPNGAKDRTADESRELRGYNFVIEALDAGLAKVKKFVWCGDTDTAGLSLRADMVQLLGAARLWFVDWPEGCKDANDMLRSDGAQALRELVTEGALPWPVVGLFRLHELPEPSSLPVWSTGIQGWDGRVMLAPRTVSVVTGQPGHGKTLLWAQIWFNVMRRYSLCACVASFETRPKPHLRRQLRSLHSGVLEMSMTDDERRTADDWINDRFLFLVHPEQRPTLKWFLDVAEVAVVRHGVRIIQLDPWNRLEASRERNESETEYIARCLRALHNFANDFNCHVQIIAHPAKMDGQRRKQPPELEDIAGSKSWEAMPDQGFTVHRPEMYEGTERRTAAVLYHRKARFEELGYPCKLALNYQPARGRYEVDIPVVPQGGAGDD